MPWIDSGIRRFDWVTCDHCLHLVDLNTQIPVDGQVTPEKELRSAAEGRPYLLREYVKCPYCGAKIMGKGRIIYGKKHANQMLQDIRDRVNP